MSLLNVARWPSILVFLIAGIAAAGFAFVTVNLFSQAMANLTFLREFGTEAIRHGALLQLVQLTVWGALSLSCWLGFKICEAELLDRYRAWSKKRNAAKTSPQNRSESAP